MRTITALGLVLASGVVLADPAVAQVDRYGGSPHARPAQVATAATAAYPARAGASTGRILSWPGKAAATQEAAPVYTAPAVAPRPTYTPPPAAPAPAASAPAYSPPARAAAPAPRAARDDGFEPLYAPTAAAQPAQPSSIYAPTPPQAPATAVRPVQQAARADGPRFYSVHREFGITPDAPPIPPAFFTATADLSEPPPETDRERRIVTGSDGQKTTVVRRSSNSGSN
jgi:hypothetical protein